MASCDIGVQGGCDIGVQGGCDIGDQGVGWLAVT